MINSILMTIGIILLIILLSWWLHHEKNKIQSFLHISDEEVSDFECNYGKSKQ